jgi:Leucine-rich repeat (LRR) protein
MKEFRINKYLTLKLEQDGTHIYIKERKFLQCAFLLLKRRIDEIEDLSEIQSVDEMSDYLDHSMEAGNYSIPSEVEFWGHCSNLQVWYENSYDTRLIHSNLAFPLLKELSNLGDPLALKVFREEITKRLDSGYEPVIEYLVLENYVDYLNREEVLLFLLDNDEAKIIYNIENSINVKFKMTYNYNDLPTPNEIIIEAKRVTGINISSNKIANRIDEVFNSLYKLEKLRCLIIDKCNLTKIPLGIHKLKNLKSLSFSNNQIGEIPETLGKLINLEYLELGFNKISKIPDALRNLTSLFYFDLRGNRINKIPDSLKKLEKALEL